MTFIIIIIIIIIIMYKMKLHPVLSDNNWMSISSLKMYFKILLFCIFIFLLNTALLPTYK